MAIGLQPLSILGFFVWTLVAVEIHCTRPPDECLSLCNCRFEHDVITTVKCLDTRFTVMPTLELGNVTSTRVLVLSGNNFTTLNDTSFPKMDSLEELILAGNDILTVQPYTFLHLGRVSILDLSDNQLSALPHLPNTIRELNLSHNRISRVDDGAFIKLTELRVLNLFNNSIGLISVNSFQGLEKVEMLNLGVNLISQLTSATFSSGLNQLSELNLHDNQISEIAPHTFNRLENLLTLNLSRNKISYASGDTFEGLSHLLSLYLSDNRIRYLSDCWTAQLPNLQYLDLSGNPLSTLHEFQLSPAPHLVTVQLNRMPELIAVKSNALNDLPSLSLISFRGSSRLKYLNPNMLGNSSALERLDLTGCSLQTLNRNLVTAAMPKLKAIALQNNPWRCDCHLKWLSELIAVNPGGIVFGNFNNISCVYPEAAKGKSLVISDLYNKLNCSNASISHYITRVSFRLGSTALLECQTEGNPKPEVSWYTPMSNVLHWYPLSTSGDSKEFTTAPHPPFHDSQGVPITDRRLQVLRNGNLFISPVQTQDAGVYMCVAGNSLGNHTVYMSMTLDFEVLQHIKIVSILVGLAVSVAFMLLMLVVQLIQMILNRWGWCCCRAALPPKAKRIRKMLESVEHYKSQQLDRLRENYNMQVQRIKDNCTQQMEKLRDSYSSQTERLRDFRDYGTHQIDRIRDQYYEQVRRVRDYSAQQMSRVRENYVVQRNRIRKFSAHQLFKLRENYKVQQLHLNKILENLNLESCRTVCARTDSVMFNSEIINMEPPEFPSDLVFPQPLPNSLSSVDIELEKYELSTLTRIHPADIKEIDFELEDEDDDSVIFQDAMDGTEFQMMHCLNDTVIVDPTDGEHSRRPSNNIVV